jgi:hypothetical protein
VIDVNQLRIHYTAANARGYPIYRHLEGFFLYLSQKVMSADPTHKSACARGALFGTIAALRGLIDLSNEKKQVLPFPTDRLEHHPIQIPLTRPDYVASAHAGPPVVPGGATAPTPTIAHPASSSYRPSSQEYSCK